MRIGVPVSPHETLMGVAVIAPTSPHETSIPVAANAPTSPYRASIFALASLHKSSMHVVLT